MMAGRPCSTSASLRITHASASNAGLAAPFASPYTGAYCMGLTLGGPLPTATGEIGYAPGFHRVELGVGAHRERPHPGDLGRDGAELEAAVGKRAEPGQMFADRNSRGQQDAVHRPRPAARIVDIVAVDPDERRALARPAIAPPLRSERDGRSNKRRCANGGPSRCGPAPPGRARPVPRNPPRRSPSSVLERPPHDDPVEPGQRAELQARQGRTHRHSGGTGCRHRCRCWRSCRSGRSGRSSRRRNWRRRPRASRNRRSAGPAGPR